MTDPIQVLRHAITMNIAADGRTDKTVAECAALKQVEALVEAVREIAENERWVQAGPLIDKARFALAPFKENP